VATFSSEEKPRSTPVARASTSGASNVAPSRHGMGKMAPLCSVSTATDTGMPIRDPLTKASWAAFTCASVHDALPPHVPSPIHVWYAAPKPVAPYLLRRYSVLFPPDVHGCSICVRCRSG